MSSRQPLSLSTKAIFTLVAMALVWGALELLTLTYWWLVPPPNGDGFQFIYQSHTYRAFAFVPNVVNRRRTESYNSFALRGREVTVEKPPDTVRIICVGASTTHSIGATSDTRTFPARMERLLSVHYRGKPFRIEVLNAGLPASVSLETLIYFQTKLLDLSPDVVIFNHAINEAGMMALFPGYRTDYSHARRSFFLPPAQWWESSPFLTWLLGPRSLLNPYVLDERFDLTHLILVPTSEEDDLTLYSGPVLTSQMRATFERNLRSFIAVARGNGVIPVLSTQSVYSEKREYRRWVQATYLLNDVTSAVAASEHVDFIDFARLMPWDAEVFFDMCHLHDGLIGLGRRARIFADALIEARIVERALERQRAVRADGGE